MNMRKICVVTGSRAEYGLLKPLLNEIKQHPLLELQLVVCFMHLVNDFGLTINEIKNDGFKIDATVDIMLANDTPVAQVKSMGLGLISFSETFERLNPDLLVVLGDRFEILSAVQAAFMARIPIAHIHGGELTLGALDDSIRHAITKLSHIHFASTEIYKKRIIQMGESHQQVFNVGALGLSNITHIQMLNKDELSNDLHINWGSRNFLVTYHPLTLNMDLSQMGLLSLLEALNQFPEANVIFTKANADEGGRWINEKLEDYVKNYPTRCFLFSSLGVKKYLSLMSYVDVVIGNSSSGIIEAPFMKKPSVNIGSREENRIKPKTVIDCKEEVNSIVTAIKKAISPKFINENVAIDNPYGDGCAERKITDIISTVDLKNISLKAFCDMEVTA